MEHLDIELRLLLGGAGQLFRDQGGLQDALSFLHRRKQKSLIIYRQRDWNCGSHCQKE